MLDKLKEFRDTFYERIKSPFIGSFMISWAVIHWKVLVMFFYTEENITISDRILKIEKYLDSKSTFDLVGYPILITLAVLIGYSILNAIGLLIKLLYDNWASPYIQKFVYNKNIVEKAKYERLKAQYTTTKKDYEEEKESFINTEKEHREMRVAYDAFRARSFDGQLVSDVTHIFEKGFEWENLHTYSDGRMGDETFTSDIDGFIFPDGSKMKVYNIKTALSGRIVSFDKIVGERTLNNLVVRDEIGDYYGIENYNIIVRYVKKRAKSIVVKSAKYGGEGIYNNVTDKVSLLVATGKIIGATNEIWGDPKNGAAKTLEIIYTVNGKEEKVVINEGEGIKLSE